MYNHSGLAGEAVRRRRDERYPGQSGDDMRVIVHCKADIFRLITLVADAHLNVDSPARNRGRWRSQDGRDRNVMHRGEYGNGG